MLLPLLLTEEIWKLQQTEPSAVELLLQSQAQGDYPESSIPESWSTHPLPAFCSSLVWQLQLNGYVIPVPVACFVLPRFLLADLRTPPASTSCSLSTESRFVAAGK